MAQIAQQENIVFEVHPDAESGDIPATELSWLLNKIKQGVGLDLILKYSNPDGSWGMERCIGVEYDKSNNLYALTFKHQGIDIPADIDDDTSGDDDGGLTIDDIH